MSRENQARIVLAALLIGVGLVRYLKPTQLSHSPFVAWTILGWVAFGLLNVMINVPGTRWLRVAAIGVAFWAILAIGESGAFVIVWLIWPPAFMVAASLGRRPQPLSAGPQPDPTATTRARVALTAVIMAVAIAAIVYRWLVFHNLQQTSALFVGIPALLAILVVAAVSPRSAVGVACKAVTVGLLVSLMFLGEGILCILMSAPLFYAIAIVIAAVMEVARRRERPPILRSCVLVLVMVPMALEGVTGFTTFNREESVAESRIIHSSAGAVERALFETPRFDRTRPLYLRAGFPSPVATRIERTSGATRWTIEFRGGETRLNGMEPRTGDLVLELEEMRPGFIRWRAISDSSHMTHFLDWRGATVQWEAIDADTTKVTWTLGYRRGLDPAWYFGPMERYAVRLAAGYLIDSVATP